MMGASRGVRDLNVRRKFFRLRWLTKAAVAVAIVQWHATQGTYVFCCLVYFVCLAVMRCEGELACLEKLRIVTRNLANTSPPRGLRVGAGHSQAGRPPEWIG